MCIIMADSVEIKPDKPDRSRIGILNRPGLIKHNK